MKPLVDYPDDDDEDDAMNTKVEDQTQPKQESSSQEDPGRDTAMESSEEAPSTPVSLTIQTPPERLSEKRRREEEDDDELMKLTAGPKRRSSVNAGSGSAGLLRRKRSVSIGSLSSNEKGSTLGNTTTSAAPKRIAINLSSATVKPTDTAVDKTSNEKENRDDNHDSQGG